MVLRGGCEDTAGAADKAGQLSQKTLGDRDVAEAPSASSAATSISLTELKVPEEPMTRKQVLTAVCSTTVGFATSFAVTSTFLITGVFFAELLDTFGKSRGETAIVGSVLEFTFAGGCLPVPALVRRFGAVKMYALGILLYVGGLVGDGLARDLSAWIVTHGLITGFGMATLFMTFFDVLYTYTPKKNRGRCVGISFAGGGVGAAVLAPLLSQAAEDLGLGTAMLAYAAGAAGYLAIIFGLVVSLATFGHHFVDPVQTDLSGVAVGDALCAPPRPRRWSQRWVRQQCADRCTNSSLVRWGFNGNFMMLLVALFIYLFGFSAPLTHLPQYVQDQGLTAEQAAGLLSIFGALNAFGRFFFAQIGDWIGGNYLHVFAATVLGNGLAVLALPLCRSYGSFAAFATFCGLVAGGRAGLLGLTCGQLFGQRSASDTYALCCLAFMFSQTLGSPVVGYIYDKSGSYDVGFGLTGALMVVAFLLLAVLDFRWTTTRKARERRGRTCSTASTCNPVGDARTDGITSVCSTCELVERGPDKPEAV